MTFQISLSALHRRLRKDATRGSAAIEFAMVAMPFFMLLFGVIETGIMYFAQFALQNSMVEASREIRTGQAQAVAYATATKCSGTGVAGPYTSQQQWFNDQICCGVSLLLDCTKLTVNVQNYVGGFVGAGFTQTTDANGNFVVPPPPGTYNPGNACDVVLVRATYSWPVVTPGLSWFLSDITGGNHLLSATTAFRNEPFTSGIGGC